MRAVLLVCLVALGATGSAATPEWPAFFPPRASLQRKGENWATSRFYWHQSLRRHGPLQFTLLVSVVFAGKWDAVSSEFSITKRGGVQHWIITSRDIRGYGNYRPQLTEVELRRVKELIPKLQVPVRRTSGGRVIVSFVEEGEWCTFAYSTDALPASLLEIFRILDFSDYGPEPKRF